MNLVLRTNLTLPLMDEDLLSIGNAFDQVVVSVDGNSETHEARRGTDTYERLVRNLERYQSLANDRAELSLAAVMRAEEIQGEPGSSVRDLARRLGVRRTRFRPLLPLGRATDWPEPPTPEPVSGHLSPMTLIDNGFTPVASCGLGQNLYVEPSGESFPCYAYHQSHALLGNVVTHRLRVVLESPHFRELARHTVDSNAKCRNCDLRYICGGACRAWVGEAAQHDLDAAPPECGALRDRAGALVSAARAFLGLAEKEDHPYAS